MDNNNKKNKADVNAPNKNDNRTEFANEMNQKEPQPKNNKQNNK